MADDKKAAKPASTTKDGYQTMGEIAGFLLILIIAAGFFMQSSVPQFLTGRGATTEMQQDSFPSPGNIQIGSKIYNKKSISIRQEPAGAIIGSQDKAEHGTVVEGPVNYYGATWWKVNYADSPDGWVEQEFITAQMVLFFIKNFFPALWSVIKVIAWWVTIILGILIAIVMIKVHKLDKKDEEEEKIEKKVDHNDKPTPVTASAIVAASSGPPLNLPTEDIVPEPVVDERWTHIVHLTQSFNENDWRQAIIEADIILEEMLEKMGYEGDTIGERLKNVEESDFTTLDKAWEAHKVRNRIAHMGSNYKLTKQEAERVIGLFKEVFEEFYFI